MAKKLKKLVLSIGTPNRRVDVELDNCDGESGYFLGSVQMGGDYTPYISFHVEAIEVKLVSEWPYGVLRDVPSATNANFQNRLDNYFAKNEGSRPCLIKINRKKYFIYIEPYAQ